jgi:hypothetical protein
MEKSDRKKFIVESFPKEKLNLFEKTDFFIYEKKFYNDLPANDLIPPKSFQYASSNENFCSFDINTMTFGLRKNQEILTDPKINTNIHKDFIDNSLKLILDYSNIMQEDGAKDYSAIKKDIIKIIDEKDEAEMIKVTKKLSSNPFYLRQSTIMGSTFYSSSARKSGADLGKKNGNNINAINPENLKTEIDKSFTRVANLKEGVTKHPIKEGVVAQKVIDIVPFHHFMDKNFTEIIFNSDPRAEVNDYSAKQFLLKRNRDDIYKFYKQDCNDLSADVTKPQYYSYEREYSISKANEGEIFNRFLLFKNDNDRKAFFVPIESKLTLKKHKTTTGIPQDEEYDMPAEKDIILEPVTYNNDSKLTTLINKGFEMSVKKDEIELNTDDISNLLEMRKNKDVVMKIAEHQQGENDNNREEDINNVDRGDNTDRDEDEDLFGSGDEDNDNDENN